ncbi:MAG: L-lactate dehydrogenase [Clostridiales bacterium]|nr:L-lactate dehydrogenase [Clostridiales bacterium]
MTDMHKCAVVGCGFVGASCAFSLVESGLFSEMVLIDVNKEKAEGEAMDLSHGVPFTRPIEVYAGDYPDLEGAGIVIIAAGANQKPGETRIDLVHKNIKIFQQIVPQITKYNSEGILLVVTNPVDILTYATLQISGLPRAQVIGSGTVLDTARLKYLLGRQLGVDPRGVHAFIIGEHGDSELAVWSSANISGVDLSEFCSAGGMKLTAEELDTLYREVRDSAYEIIDKKGATYYGIAMSVRRICESIVRDERSILPVSSLITGHYGLTDICMGVPSILGREGVERVLDIPLNVEENARLLKSAASLREVLKSI